MATFDLGKVAMAMKGAYSSSTAYTKLDVVRNRGGSFICTASCTGVEPGVTSGWESYWELVTEGIHTISVTRDSTTSNTIVRIVMTSGTVQRFELAPV